MSSSSGHLAHPPAPGEQGFLWGRTWTRKMVRAGIRQRHQSGLSLMSLPVQTDNSPLYRAGRRLHGTWVAAVRAAGLGPKVVTLRNRWTKTSLIQGIQALRRRGVQLNFKSVEKRASLLLGSARVHFGSWAKALKAAGVDPQKVRLRRLPRPWSRSLVLEEVRRLSRKGPLPSSVRIQRIDVALYHAAKRYCGGWSRLRRLNAKGSKG